MIPVDWHQQAFQAYQSLPSPFQQVVRTVYEDYVEGSNVAPNYKRKFVRQFFDEKAEFESYEREFKSSEILADVQNAREEHRRRTGHNRFAAINKFTHPRLYALVRKLNPDTVVETGVCNGVSTYIILQALEENGHGHLHSIDYPDSERIPSGEEPGWIIPDHLRQRWSLTKGLSQKRLPGVVAEMDQIDLFLHDTAASVFGAELDIVWPKLAPNAVVTADDIHQSDAFRKAVDARPVDYGHVAPNVGYLIKRK